MRPATLENRLLFDVLFEKGPFRPLRELRERVPFGSTTDLMNKPSKAAGEHVSRA
jgi:hypothetical protein